MMPYFFIFSIDSTTFLVIKQTVGAFLPQQICSHCLVSSVILACNQGKDLLCKGNDYAARKRQKSIRSLGRIMGFQGKTDLHDTKAEWCGIKKVDSLFSRIP